MLQKIMVSDISEYPTTFSKSCSLLIFLGIEAFTSHEEEIEHILRSTSTDYKYMKICCESKQCGSILKGLSAYVQFTDPILLDEYNGEYRVIEGKHRVCMAKRANIDWLWAKIIKLPNDHHKLLSRIGEPGAFSFELNTDHRYVLYYVNHGQLQYMVLDSKDFDSKDFNRWHETNIEGVEYLVTQKRWRQKILRVKISPNHTKMKFWLKATQYCTSYVNEGEGLDIYRYGLWRKHHFNQILK